MGIPVHYVQGLPKWQFLCFLCSTLTCSFLDQDPNCGRMARRRVTESLPFAPPPHTTCVLVRDTTRRPDPPSFDGDVSVSLPNGRFWVDNHQGGAKARIQPAWRRQGKGGAKESMEKDSERTQKRPETHRDLREGEDGGSPQQLHREADAPPNTW
eukprot:scaffold1501_cov352-Pavlova_lutheri.AAC.51